MRQAVLRGAKVPKRREECGGEKGENQEEEKLLGKMVRQEFVLDPFPAKLLKARIEESLVD